MCMEIGIDTCKDMGACMCTCMCIDTCMPMNTDMCIDTRNDVYVDMLHVSLRVEMCNVCVGMYMCMRI